MRNRLAAARLVFILGTVGSFAALTRAATQKREQLKPGEAGGRIFEGSRDFCQAVWGRAIQRVRERLVLVLPGCRVRGGDRIDL